MQRYYVGSVLSNGAKVIAVSSDAERHCYVLAYTGNSVTPYVVWYLYPSGSCEHGDYYQQLSSAAQAYEEKCRDSKLDPYTM